MVRLGWSLANGATVTLHMNGLDGKEFWDVSKDWACIFNHHLLEELTISSANIDVNTLSGIDSSLIGKTPLRSLTLDECNVDHSGLRAVLMMPKALERFSLGKLLVFVSCYALTKMTRGSSKLPGRTWRPLLRVVRSRLSQILRIALKASTFTKIPLPRSADRRVRPASIQDGITQREL